MKIVLVPGFSGSGGDHWQTWLEENYRGVTRVRQTDWFNPTPAWADRIEEHLEELRAQAVCGGSVSAGRGEDVLLVAHSCGSIAAATWLANGGAMRHPEVIGAILVCPADTETDDAIEEIKSLPIPWTNLTDENVKTLVVASDDDPHCSTERAQLMATTWKSEFVGVGNCGHINIESGYGPWPRIVEIIEDFSRQRCQPYAISQPSTPFLMVDARVLSKNIHAMADAAAHAGIAIRPHAKTHKCLPIAQLQLAAGACGLTVATLEEAEGFAQLWGADGSEDSRHDRVAGDSGGVGGALAGESGGVGGASVGESGAGIAREAGRSVERPDHAERTGQTGGNDLFIAYPLWIDGKAAARIRSVSEKCSVSVGVDNTQHIGNIAVEELSDRVSVMIEIDSGMHRSGVAPGDAALLARHAVKRGVKVRGIFTFPGHSYAPGERESAAVQEQEALRCAYQAVRDVLGVDAERLIVSGGSSPTVAATLNSGWGSSSDDDFQPELRPGAYVFNDAQQWELGACGRDDIALTCHATVVSAGQGRIVLDSGSKALGADRAAWASGFGRLLDYPDARIVKLSEHHAVVEGAPELEVGARVRVVPNHCCNAVVLAEKLYVNGVVSDMEGSAGGESGVAGRGVAVGADFAGGEDAVSSGEGVDGGVAAVSSGGAKPPSIFEATQCWPIIGRGK